jgi:hypothetical protein
MCFFFADSKNVSVQTTAEATIRQSSCTLYEKLKRDNKKQVSISDFDTNSIEYSNLANSLFFLRVNL